MKRGDQLKKSVRAREARESALRKALSFRRRRTKAIGKEEGRSPKWKRSRALLKKVYESTKLSHLKAVVARKRLTNYRKKLAVQNRPLRLRAYDQAESLIGVMEIGGNNVGPVVSKIIRENAGTVEPWCGDFDAYCYRHAGSKAVTRAWASVWWLGFGGLAGLRQTWSPKRGDIVIFNFSHTGLFDKDNGNGTITTIEGNTGSSGAVSDSSTGGDGVYRKIRSKALVSRYVRVLR